MGGKDGAAYLPAHTDHAARSRQIAAHRCWRYQTFMLEQGGALTARRAHSPPARARHAAAHRPRRAHRACALRINLMAAALARRAMRRCHRTLLRAALFITAHLARLPAPGIARGCLAPAARRCAGMA